MAATHTPGTDEQTEARFTRALPPPEPPEPDGLPGGAGARFLLIAVLIVGALIATGLVLVDTGGDQGGGAAAPAPTAGSRTPAAPAVAAAPAAAARSIAVTLKEFSVSPQPVTGRAGRVTFHVRNAGAVKHEFVVLRTNTPAAGLRKGSEADETGNVGEIGDLQPGASKTLALRLRPGHYALICNLPGHYLAGQRADFTVR
jgi:uncharacterized cupredoxin-like copper-binding protein